MYLNGSLLKKLSIHSSSNRTEAAGMCGLCCSKSKLKQQKKNEDKEDEKRFNGKNEKTSEPLQEEPTKLQHLQSLNEHVVQKKQPEEEEEEEEEDKSMEEDKQTTHESLASDDEKRERKIPSRNEWMSDITGFPSFNQPKAIDKTVLPNMINSGTKREEKASKDEEINIDETEFPWTIPPLIEDSEEEEDDEEEAENYDDQTEFPVNAPRVDSDDGGISFPYNKPPKYN